MTVSIILVFLVLAMVIRFARMLRRRGPSSLRGSIGRVTVWGDGTTTAVLLSGRGRGTEVDIWSDAHGEGDHVVLVEETSAGWRVVDLDET